MSSIQRDSIHPMCELSLFKHNINPILRDFAFQKSLIQLWNVIKQAVDLITVYTQDSLHLRQILTQTTIYNRLAIHTFISLIDIVLRVTL